MTKNYYINNIQHDAPIVKEKLNYFVDSIELCTVSIGEPLYKPNTNGRLLCNLIHKLLTNPVGNDRKKHIKHLYHFYSNILNPPIFLPLEHFKEEFESASSLILQYCKEQISCDELKNQLSPIVDSLNRDFLKNTIEQLIAAILCKEDLNSHKHTEILDYCAHVLVTEYYFIGFRDKEVSRLFNIAVGQYLELVDELSISELKSVPIPPEIYELNKNNIESLREAIKIYYRQTDIKKQLNNLYYIHSINNSPKTFIFKVNNISIGDLETFCYNRVTFSNSFEAKYVFDYTIDQYKDFLRPSSNWLYAEVEVIRGTKDAALDKAIQMLKQGLDFIYYNLHMDYHIDTRSLKPEIDLSQYIMKDSSSNIIATRSSRKLKKITLQYMRENEELEVLKNVESVRNYLQIDKIYYKAFSSDSLAESASEFWRYCESFFENYKKGAPEVIERILSVILLAYPNHIYYAPLKMGLHLGHQYKYSNFCTESGMGFEKLHSLISNVALDKDTLEKMAENFYHPIFNKLAKLSLSMSIENSNRELDKHYYLVLKNCNIQRNLLQHSNVSIDELDSMTEIQLPYFMSCVKFLIIQSLKSDKHIESIEELFPKISLPPERLPKTF